MKLQGKAAGDFLRRRHAGVTRNEVQNHVVP